MKKYLFLILLLGYSGLASAREPAQVRFYCRSLQFQPATGSGGQTSLEMTSDPSFTEMNGEVGPLFDPSLPAYGAVFRLTDLTIDEATPGQIAFDLPEPADANGNGFEDFFEVSQGVASASASGIFETPVDDGDVTATWSRPAGSVAGTCRLRLTSNFVGPLGQYTFAFALIEYTGKLTYFPDTNLVVGALALAQTDNASNTITGPISLARVPLDRLNKLTLLAGSLTNALDQALVNWTADIQRDEGLKTNYYAFVDFQDGDPGSAAPDFLEWVLSIDDPNDSNSNGVPDLSDVPGNAPAGPLLGLARLGTELRLSIQANPGQIYDLEEALSLNQTNWLKSTSITLTNNPQLLSLPLPDTATKFWRLRGR